ncbi:MAG: thioredoxin [Bacteroidales bacterium]|jgi:thioredoxin|nr:thioredoxin [Bacteroidales bacterium]ODT54621.1 MAG: thioredoxin [Paludibacter sp. SCN 50-10]OJX87807.1 MAG: thioredoxin [Paludibacter sp. 47-17]
MRKIVVASLALILIAFTACGNQSKDKATEKNADNITTNETKKMGTIKLTKAEFLTKVANYEANPSEWKYLGDKPCIIDFYADWCGPCKTIAPILEDLAKEYDGQIYIYKVDTEKEQELAAAFGIRSIPSLLFVPMNEQPQMAMGALPKETFKKAIEEVLLKKTN